MNTILVMWIIIIIIVTIAVLALAFYFARRRQVAHHRTQAAELRHTAQNDELVAREVEAKAALADAEAKQSEVDATRSRQEAEQQQHEAVAVREHSNDQARQADELDPDIDVRSRRKTRPDDAPVAAEQAAASDRPAAGNIPSSEGEADQYDGAPGTGPSQTPH